MLSKAATFASVLFAAALGNELETSFLEKGRELCECSEPVVADTTGIQVTFNYAYANFDGYTVGFLDVDESDEADNQSDSKLRIETNGGFEYDSPPTRDGPTNANFSDVMPRGQDALKFKAELGQKISLQVWDVDFGLDEAMGEVTLGFEEVCTYKGNQMQRALSIAGQ